MGDIKIKKLWEKDAEFLRWMGCKILRPDDVRAATFSIYYKGKPIGLGFDVFVSADGRVRMWPPESLEPKK